MVSNTNLLIGIFFLFYNKINYDKIDEKIANKANDDIAFALYAYSSPECPNQSIALCH